MAARCIGVFSKMATMETMNCFLEQLLPWLGAIDDSTKQEGAIEAMACILHTKMQVCVFFKMRIFLDDFKALWRSFTDKTPALCITSRGSCASS